MAKRDLRDLKPSGVVCGRTAKLHRRLFPLSCLLMAPLVILDHWRFSLFEWITRFVVVEKMWKSCACGRQRPLQTIIWSPAVQESGWILNKFWFWNLNFGHMLILKSLCFHTTSFSSPFLSSPAPLWSTRGTLIVEGFHQEIRKPEMF